MHLDEGDLQGALRKTVVSLCFALNFPARQGIFRPMYRTIARKIPWRAGKFKAKQRVQGFPKNYVFVDYVLKNDPGAFQL